MRGATGKTPLCHKCFVISIHAPRAGRDFSGCFCSQSFLYFNPRAPCGARLDASDVDLMIFDISIHAPRAGRDEQAGIFGVIFDEISIHAPRAGRDRRPCRWFRRHWNFNPRAPCGARPVAVAIGVLIYKFQSTRPVRGATATVRLGQTSFPISIHAPRAGRDFPAAADFAAVSNFNPRAPCGARRQVHLCVRLPLKGFQSTRPVRGATQAAVAQAVEEYISIHAPRAGRDRHPGGPGRRQLRFQSTRPVRGATRGSRSLHYQRRISIHAPRAGRDRPHPVLAALRQISIHAPRAGRDLVAEVALERRLHFNPRAPCGARRNL